MQAKKAKQLLRARLARERQIYEMRKRAELNAAVSELERPWEIVETAPKLFSTSADEQVKVLADRFQKPGGFDLWSKKDGPQLFETVEGVPSARFFPKGVVHSVRPYGRITDGNSDRDTDDSGVGYKFPGQDMGLVMGNENKETLKKDGRRRKGMNSDSSGNRLNQRESGSDRRRIGMNSDSGGNGSSQRDSGSDWRKDSRRGNGRKEESGSNAKVFDMNLQDDGSYGVSKIKQRTERK